MFEFFPPLVLMVYRQKHSVHNNKALHFVMGQLTDRVVADIISLYSLLGHDKLCTQLAFFLSHPQFCCRVRRPKVDA